MGEGTREDEMISQPKPNTVRDAGYLRWLRTLPCAWCAKPAPSEASHHGRHGIGLKASDHDAVPLCGPWGCHRYFHRRGVLPKLHAPIFNAGKPGPTNSGAEVRDWAAAKALTLRELYARRAP